MKLEELIKGADFIDNLQKLHEIMQQPRQGKIYTYHQGMVANDKLEKKDLRGVSNRIRTLADRNELMSFQKKIRDGKYIYFIVR